MKLALVKDGESCSMLGGSSASLFFKQVGDATYGRIYEDYIPMKAGNE